MISLTQLPYNVIELIFTNLNQHQAIALAPLHSKFYFPAKDKLFHYIYVYDIQENYTGLTDLAYENEFTCALPGFRFPKYMNNYSTNRATIVSRQSFELYWQQIDSNQAIEYLVFAHEPCNFHKIKSYFRRIKYFIDQKRAWGFHTARVWTASTPEQRYVCFRKVGSIIFRFTNNTNIGDKPFSASGSYLLSRVGNNFGSMPTSDDRVLKPYLTPKKLHVFLDRVPEFVFIISQNLNTLSLRLLFITLHSGTIHSFANYKLDEDYPNLFLLGISYNDENSPATPQSIPHLTHQTLRFLTVATLSVTDALARRICELTLQFPEASINWWSSVWITSGAPAIEHQYIFSAEMPLGCIAIQWVHKCMREVERIELKYEVGENNVVELRRNYSDSELLLLWSLYYNKNSLYYF